MMKWRRFPRRLDNIEQSILNIQTRNPRVIGIARPASPRPGRHVDGYLKSMRQAPPGACGSWGFVMCRRRTSRTPFQDGSARPYEDHRGFAPRYERVASARSPARKNVLAGCHPTRLATIDELRDIIECFAWSPLSSRSLRLSRRHIPEDFTPTTLGVRDKSRHRSDGNAGWTLAIGEQMRDAP